MATALETTATERFEQLPGREDPKTYNFDHFRAHHLMVDVAKTVRGAGLAPGSIAPDFELPAAETGTVRLRALRGRPVLLHFGSYT